MGFYKEDLSCHSYQDSKYAQDLFGKSGYVLLKNFCTPLEVEYLKSNYSDLTLYTTPHYHSINYLYKYIKKNYNEIRLLEIVKRIFKKRIEISLQKNADFLVLDYCCRHNISPNDITRLTNSYLSHTFYRFNRQFAGQSYHAHVDLPGEVQCVLYLSKKGIDYESGGLHVLTEDDRDIDVDSLAAPGDLVILNSYARKHYVDAVVTKSSKDFGRFTLFVPVIPEYIFGPFYYFRNNRFKLYFADYVKVPDKVLMYLKYFYSLIKLSPKPPVD